MSQQRLSTSRQFAHVQATVLGMGDAFAAGLLAQLRAFKPQLEARMKAGVPSRSGPRPAKFAASRPGMRPSGGLKSLLTTEVDDKELRLSAGLLTPEARGRGFYGFILDAGRGLKRSRSKPKHRFLGTAPSLVKGFRNQRNIFSKYYSRKISPILPGRFDITFGRVRTFARDTGGRLLLAAYDEMLAKTDWKN